MTRHAGLHSVVRINRPLAAFTLIELITVLGILTLLTGILLPALAQVRAQARALQGKLNQRQVTLAVNLYAMDYDEQYPGSVAKVGFGDFWNWSDPTKLAGSDLRTPGLHRSVSHYLRPYLTKPQVLVCPSIPDPYDYLERSWQAGDAWDNPETPIIPDSVGGSLCLYWNYVGLVGDQNRLWHGPTGPQGGRRTSRLLISHYLGFNHWRSPGRLISCEKLPRAEVVSQTLLLSSLWSAPTEPGGTLPALSLTGTFTDEHVETFSTTDLVPMRVIKDRANAIPYSDDEPGPGIVYLPRDAVP